MDTSLILYLDGVWQEVDLYEDIPITVVIQEVDIIDLQGRKSPYSKQFTVPGTSKNSNIFKHYYEVNGIEFNPLIKIQAAVQYRGTDIFNGIARLQAVIINDQFIEYEIYIMGDVGDFISQIKDLLLADLQWDDLQHQLNYSSVTESWKADGGETNGLFGGKILYPMINYGLKYSGTSTIPYWSFDFSGATSFTQPTHPVIPSYFKPAIRVRDLLQRIFDQTDYTINSPFFDSEYFRSIYMDTFMNGQLGVTSASAVTNQNLFRVYMRPYTVYAPREDGSGSTGKNIRPHLETFSPDGYDYLNNFTLGTSTTTAFNPPDDNFAGYFTVPYPGVYSWNFRYNYDGSLNSPYDWVYFQFVARKGTDLATLDSQPAFAAGPVCSTLIAPNAPGQAVNWFFTGNCQAGEYVKLYIYINAATSPTARFRIRPYQDLTSRTSAPQWDLFSSPTLAGLQTVDIKLGIGSHGAIDIFKAIITMFNLVVVQDVVNKQLLIQPYNTYYNEPDRQEKDWSNKLDLTSSYRVEPLSFNLAKELVFTYTKGSEEYLNKIWEDTNDYNYGRFRYIANSNILTDLFTYEIPFAALPSSGVTNAPNFIIPQVWRDLNNQQAPYSSQPHLFFWVGNRYMYADALKTQQNRWYLLSGTTAIPQTTYPCVSHLSSLDIYDPNFVSDLNFGTDFDFFGNTNTFPIQATPYTTYSSFWKDFIDNNYSNETRRLTGKFYLWPLDIYETKLTDKIFIKDSFYRIEKITDGNLISPQFTEVSLIKERGGYYAIDPPAPYYFVQPNAPYPPPPNPTLVISYASTDQASVCNATATPSNVYTNGTLPFTNGAQVFSLSGSTYVPLPQGTYVRWTGDTNTYVVINNTGQIVQATC